MIRPRLRIGDKYLFKQHPKGTIYEATVLRFGVRERDDVGGQEQNFAMVKLLIDGKTSWVLFDTLEIQELYPPDEEMKEMGYGRFLQ